MVPKQETSFLGVDIGASSVKIVQLRASRGIAVLETYGEISLGPYGNQPIGKAVKLSPEKTAEAITDLMKEANITARTGGVSIPFSGSLVSVLDLPDVDEEQLKRIVEIQLARLRQRLAERKIELTLTDAAEEHFASAGYDPVYGARPLKRLLQKEIETNLGRKILAESGLPIISANNMAEAAEKVVAAAEGKRAT